MKPNEGTQMTEKMNRAMRAAQEYLDSLPDQIAKKDAQRAIALVLVTADEEISALHGCLAEVVSAMERYEMAVDDPPPFKHRELMQRAKRMLPNSKGQP